MSTSWRVYAQQLSELLQSGGRGNEERVLQLLDSLNTPLYPIEYLRAEDIHSLVQCLVNHAVADGAVTVRVAQLIYNLLTYQKAAIQSELLKKLLHHFLSSLATTDPPNELLYSAATILSAGISHEDPESLVDESKPLFQIALTPSHPVRTQRAGLHFLSTLCEQSELSREVLVRILDALLQSFTSTRKTDPADPILLNKLLLSKIRLLHSLLPHLSPFPSGSLPILLSALKANMAVGLPGHNKSSSSMSSIQPPLPVPLPPSHKSRPMHSVAGPQDRRAQGKGRNRSKTKTKTRGDGGGGDKISSDDSSVQSSDGESSLSSASEASLSSQRSLRPQYQGAESRGKSWQEQDWRKRKGRGVSSSESEVSDGDGGSTKLKTVLCKIRHQALTCLTVLFQLLDRHTAFSYWLSFLPDGPRPPNSMPLLLTCILKDPIPKSRGAAVSVLCAMLEGSKSYLAVADDKPRPSQAFTPYSVTIGGVVRELHRGLLLALTAEPHPTTLTQLIKALGLLVANSPYHQLSEGYIGRVTATLGRLSYHRDMNVQIAVLTCYGAVISLSPSHCEVEQWLQSPSDPSGTPWLLQHCTSLLQIQSSQALQTESLQVLAALAKFYFPQISHCWQQMKDLYLTHLSSLPNRIQQHVLKMLEELCRALSSSPSADTAVFWEELLGGPLTSVLQSYSELSGLSAQACDILATMSPRDMEAIKTPYRMLALTLPLGLSKEDSAPNTVTSSAVRVLGVFVLFDTLREDSNFFLDCQSAITHCLSSATLTVRVQASWALANLLDSLSQSSQALSLQPTLLLSLCEAVQSTLLDSDRVKCNGVRAAGNLLKQLPENITPSCEATVDKFSVQLAKCVNTGAMKTRWNACYACHSAFSNPVFVSKFASNVAQLLSSLCIAVQSCKNFKVRNNAAMALSGAALAGVVGPEQFAEVWTAMLQALDNSEQQLDFSEFKHAATLKKQLCIGICHLLIALPTSSDSRELPSGELKESSSRQISRFLAQASVHEEDEEKDQEREETRVLVEKARQSLEQAVLQDSTRTGTFEALLSIFRRNCEGRSE